MLFKMLGLCSSFIKVFVPSPLSTARNLGIAADCDEVFTRTNFALNAFGNRIKIAKTKATFIMHPKMPFSAIFEKVRPRLQCKKLLVTLILHIRFPIDDNIMQIVPFEIMP